MLGDVKAYRDNLHDGRLLMSGASALTTLGQPLRDAEAISNPIKRGTNHRYSLSVEP
jgi:hypothetical protein